MRRVVAVLAAPFRARAVPLLLLSMVVLVAAPAAAQAAGTPDIALDKTAPEEVLIGDTSPVTLTASNPGGQPVAYNLSFRDVLPAGVAYVPGSAGGAGAPTILPNRPAAGQTTLIWTNLADLSPASQYTLTYRVSPSGAVPDATYTNAAGAYVNGDPRFVPDFDPVTGQPTTDITGSATDSATTLLKAIQITKSEPSPEGELLRGLHDHQTVYTLHLKNNLTNPTSNLAVDDYLPANLEFLGCPGAAPFNDNTTPDNPVNAPSTQEYAGSGPINPGNAPAAPDCLAPTLVETVQLDPDGPTGPLAFGVYTHVRWTGLGTLPATGTRDIQYVAAVPKFENTMAWGALGTATPPTPASLRQAANLDNNGGPQTTDEQPILNGAVVSGIYNATTPVTDEGTLLRTAEDMAIQKSVTPDTIAVGAVSTWTLQTEIGEYSAVDDVVVTDTVPDGLCPLNGAAPLQAGPDCAGSDVPSSPYATGVDAPVENADGTWTLTWKAPTTPQFASMPSSHTNAAASRFTITFPTRTRSTYRQNGANAGPVLANDAWTNTVHQTGTRVEGNLAVIDDSQAGQSATGPTLDKTTAPYDYTLGATPCSALDPGNGHGADGDYSTTPASVGAGDRVCWKLRMNFPAGLDTGGVNVTDFIPTNATYDVGSMQPTANNTATIDTFDPTTTPGVLSWTLGTSTIVGQAQVFEVVLSTTIASPASHRSGDLIGNLMKASTTNTAGESFPLRSQADYLWDAPELSLLKGVRQVTRNGAPVYTPPKGPNVDDIPIKGGDVVTYRVDVTNDGTEDAVGAEVWDMLPPGVTCALVTGISDGGACPGGAGGTKVVWTGLGIPASPGTLSLTYDVTYPQALTDLGSSYVNHAGVRTYQAKLNTGPADFFTYVPTHNIDPTIPDGALSPSFGTTAGRAKAADDPSRVFVAQPTLAKTRTTEVDEAGNAKASQATIGERIDYTVTLTVPAGTTVANAKVNDPLDSTRQTLVTLGAHAPAVAFDDGASTTLPAGTTFSTTGNTVTLTLPASYATNPTGSPAGTHDAVFTITYSAIVRNVAANSSSGATLPNTASLSADAFTTVNRSTTTTIVEPKVAIAKAHAPASSTVAPGDDITYTVTPSNASGTGVSTAHDVVVTDVVPAGMTYTAGSASLTPDAVLANTPTAGRTTVRWTLPAALAPGASSPITYHATVDAPAVAGAALTNTATVTAASLDDTAGDPHPERRTAANAPAGVGGVYTAGASTTLRLHLPTIDKTVSPASGPVGTVLDYTVTATIPANTRIYNGTVLDVLEDGLAFDGYTSATCAGCSPGITPVPLTPASTDPATGRTKIAWYLGDDSGTSTSARVVVLHYAAHVAKTYTAPPAGRPVPAGATLDNQASILSNETPKTAPTTPAGVDPSSYDQHAEDPATVTVTRPQLAVAKTVADGAAQVHARTVQPGGGPYDFTVTVTNTGDAPAYDATVVDVLPKGTTYVTGSSSVTPSSVQADTPAAGQTTVTWKLAGPVAVGTPQSITYKAALAASGTLNTGSSLTNTVDIPSYFEVPAAERTSHPTFAYNEYDDVTPDSDVLTPSFPQLTTTKSAPNGPNAEIGQPFRWQVRVSNVSAVADARDVDVTDVLPPDWSYVAGSAQIDTGSGFVALSDPSGAATSTLLWSNVANLAHGAHLDIRFDARPLVAAAAHANPHVNTTRSTGDDASGASGNADGPYKTTDATANATLQVPDDAIVKTPDGAPATADAPAAFSIAVSETTGNAPLRDVQVVDVLPAGTSYTPGTATATPSAITAETVQADTPSAGRTTITWTLADIAASGSTAITVPVHVANGLADGTTLTNTATVTTREVPTPKSDTGSLVVDSAPDLVTAKSATPASGTNVAPASSIAYAVRYENTGNEDATAVTLVDDIPAHTTYVLGSATSTPTATVEYRVGGVYQPGEPASGALVQGLRWTVGTVPADGPAGTVGFTAKVDDPIVNGTHVLNTATIDSSQTPPTPTNTTDHVVESAPELALAKTVDHETLDVPVDGSVLAYGLTLTNTGNEDATDVTITDAPPAGTTVAAIPAPPTGVSVECDTGTGFASCPADLTAVQRVRWSAATVTTATPLSVGFSVRLTPPTANDTVIPNTGSYDSAETPPGDSNEVRTRILTSGALTIDKTGPASALAGSVVTYELAAVNTGPSTATGVTITDELAPGTTFVPDASSPGCSVAAATVSCPVGRLAAGAGATVRVAVQTTEDQAGTSITDTAGVTAAEHPDPVTDPATTELTGAPGLALRKELLTDTPLADRSMTYRVTVTSTGTLTAQDVTVADTMTGNVRIKSATPGQGTCAIDGKRITCALGALAPAQVVAITVVATPLDAGTVKNTAAATARGIATPSQDTVSAKVSLPRAAATLRKRLVRPRSGSVPVGATVRYELAYRVTSAAAARGVRICDALPSQLSLVRAPGATVKGRRACWTHALVRGHRTVRHTITARVLRGTATGRLRNVATATAANARKGRAGAQVTVPQLSPGFTG